MRVFHRAFTLIELLVVIAIISMLAAILFPVFVQAKDWVKQNTDMANARQVGVALDLYDKDNDDMMPIYHQYNTNPAPWQDGHAGVEVALLPYAKSKIAFKSPVDQGSPVLTRPTFVNVQDKSTMFGAFGTSYHWVACMMTVVPFVSMKNDVLITDVGWTTNLSQIENSGETRLIRLEMMPFFSRFKHPTACRDYGYDCPSNAPYSAWANIAGSVIFADLHSKLVQSPKAFDKHAITPEGDRSGDPRPDSWSGTWFGACD